MCDADDFIEGPFTHRWRDDLMSVNHPLREIGTMANKTLAKVGELFVCMHVEDIKGGPQEARAQRPRGR